MPAPTYYQPIEAILNGNCNYEYYNYTEDTFSKTSRSRICHVELAEDSEYNKDIALLIFTIRNQSGAWKIHSEGIKRMDPGAMVPLRNATVKLAKEKGWKFIAVAVAGEDTPNTENISQYVVSIESYTYGDETVGVLTDALEELNTLGNPDFHRFKTDINGKEYSLAFIKKENFIEYLTYFDDRPHSKIEQVCESRPVVVNDQVDEDAITHSFFGMHIKELNNCLDANNPHVCIGWSVLGDLTAVTTKAQIEELYDKHLPDRSPNSRGQDIGQICRFKFDMHVGDLVVYGDGSTGHIGVVDSDYYYEQQDDQTQSTDYINNRKVKWLRSVPYTEMPQNLRNAVGSAMSIFSLNEYKKEILGLLDKTIGNHDNGHIIINDKNNTNYSIEELGVLLKQMYDASKETGQVASIHMFGFKYGKQITENSYSINKIVAASGLPASYTAEVNKGVNIYKSTLWNEYGIRFYNNQEDISEAGNDVNILPSREPRENQLHYLNSILYGAPGTGKTYATAEYALAIIENRAIDLHRKTDSERKEVMSKYKEYVKKGQIVFTTFHQSYGYEDFIQGLRPDNSGNTLSFKTVDGVFKKISDIAIADKENNYVIVIDEINRANISKVFGELITLIETDKRWGEINEISVTLPSGDLFAVPNNLYIVGTMNSADKSISLIDAALRRRFNFVEKTPDSSLITDVKLRKVLDTLNIGLANELDSTDLLIGHAYFIGRNVEDLADIMNSSIIPLLYEYFYDNKDKVKAQVAEAIKDLDYEIHGGKIGRINIVKKG